MRDIKVKFKLKSLPKLPKSDLSPRPISRKQPLFKVSSLDSKSQKRKPLFLKLGLTILGVLIIFMLGIFSGKTMEKAYANALQGKDNVENILSINSNDQDFNSKVLEMQQDLTNAENNFSQAKKETRKIYFLAAIPILGEATSSVDNLVNSGFLTVRAVNNLASRGSYFYNYFLENHIDLGKISDSQIKDIVIKFSGIKPTIDSSLTDVKKAKSDLNQVPFFFKVGQVKGTTDKLSTGLDKLDEFLSISSDLVDSIPKLLGVQNTQKYLILFQNYEELRPSGGFLGTYGILILKNGKIEDLKTDNIYNLHICLQDVEAPKSIKGINNQQVCIQDSNWSPDFPTSAKQVELFLKKGKTDPQFNNFDGVIAFDPKVLEYLLEVVGPTQVETSDYSYIFTSTNVVDILQRHTEKTAIEIYGNEQVQKYRKQIIGELFDVLIKKTFELPKERWLNLASYLKKALDEKHILIYSHDQRLQDILTAHNFDGQIKGTKGDYLCVVDANLGGNKSNSALEQNITYSLDLNESNPQVTLKLNYFLNSPKTWKVRDYASYTRIYVPKGSRLIESQGLEEQETFEELGKTVFAGWVKVPVLQHREFKLVYKLPSNIFADNFTYHLLFQKQAGTMNIPIEVQVDLPKYQRISEVFPSDPIIKDTQMIRWVSDLETDREFYIK